MGDQPRAMRSVLGRLTGSAKERRGSQRVRVSGLWCDRGQIIDLSSRGMRITTHRRWPEGRHRRLTLSDGSRSTTVDARCVWCRQEGLFTHAVGLAFEISTADQEQVLSDLARSNTDALHDTWPEGDPAPAM